MSSFNIEKNRNVVPRWYPYNIANLVGDTQPNSAVDLREYISKQTYKEKEADWLKSKNLTFASGLIGAAFTLGDLENPNVLDASKFVLENKRASNLSRHVAKKLLKVLTGDIDDLLEFNVSNNTERIHNSISKIKKDLKEYPFNPIKWTDLAFYYSVIGQNNKADKCIVTALALNSENRFLLRSAARFFLHTQQQDKALYFLRKSSISKKDPWIISSEISISDSIDKTPLFLKYAKEILAKNDFDPHQVSELAGSLGNLEINRGSSKKGKKLFEMSLNDPTENVLAQIEWLKSKGELRSLDTNMDLSYTFEAKARKHFRDRNYQEALKCALEWLGFQPFTTTPAAIGTYIASTALDDHESAVKIARFALIASPDNFTLKNNLAFSLALTNEKDEAKKIMEGIKYDSLTAMEKAVCDATFGAIEYRYGNFDKGRELYKKSVELFKKINDEPKATLALYHWSREEERINPEAAKPMKEAVQELAKKYNINEIMDKDTQAK